MSSSHHVDAYQTAVPTLKVMRLQSPELTQPYAGSLDSRCMLGTSMTLPDSFGVINVGETFTAYLGALNVSLDLPVTKLTVAAQLQTPSHRWPLPTSLDAGNSAGGVSVQPGDGVDAIVSRALEEPGQHILRVEVGYGIADGGTKTLRKFYRFNVSTPLHIRELTLRGGDASCFVSIAVENPNSAPLTICTAEFQTPQGLIAELIQSNNSENKNNKDDTSKRRRAVELFDSCGRLEPGASFRYLFIVKASSEDASMRGIACGDELGKAVFMWRKAMGESGRIASASVLCPESKPPGLLSANDNPSRFMMGSGSRYVVHGSGLSVDIAAVSANRSLSSTPKEKGLAPALDQVLPVSVEPVDPPSRMKVAAPQQVQFLVVNHSSQPKNLQLQMRLSNMNGVVVCGPSFQNLGEITPSGGSSLISVRFVALVAGLLRVQGCCIVDLNTGKEIPQPPLFNVFVENAIDQ